MKHIFTPVGFLTINDSDFPYATTFFNEAIEVSKWADVPEKAIDGTKLSLMLRVAIRLLRIDSDFPLPRTIRNCARLYIEEKAGDDELDPSACAFGTKIHERLRHLETTIKDFAVYAAKKKQENPDYISSDDPHWNQHVLPVEEEYRDIRNAIRLQLPEEEDKYEEDEEASASPGFTLPNV